MSKAKQVERRAPSEPVGGAVNHPSHYNTGAIEVIAAIDDWRLGFSLGNAVKYIARAAHKGSKVEDLRKARWYLQHEIERLEQDQHAEALLRQILKPKRPRKRARSL